MKVISFFYVGSGLNKVCGTPCCIAWTDVSTRKLEVTGMWGQEGELFKLQVELSGTVAEESSPQGQQDLWSSKPSSA